MARRVGVVGLPRAAACFAMGVAALVACGEDGGPGLGGDFTGTWKTAPVCFFASGIGRPFTLVLRQTGTMLSGTIDRAHCDGYEGPVSGTISRRTVQLTVGPSVWRAELAPGVAELTFHEDLGTQGGQRYEARYRFARE